MRDSNPELHHQLSKSDTINQNNLIDGTSEFQCLRSKGGRGDEHTLGCAPTRQSTVESLYWFAPYGALPSLGLDEDFFEAKTIQGNHSINPAVTHSTYVLEISTTCSISHRMQKVEN